MMYVVLLFGMCWSFGVAAFFGDMDRAMSAPQQCVAIGSAIFTLLAPYTAMKAYFAWKAMERLEEIHESFKKLSEHLRA